MSTYMLVYLPVGLPVTLNNQQKENFIVIC